MTSPRVCVSLHCSSAGDDCVHVCVHVWCLLRTRACTTVPVVLRSPVSRLIGSMEVETNYMFCFLWTSSINQLIMRESTALQNTPHWQSNGGKRLKLLERAWRVDIHQLHADPLHQKQSGNNFIFFPPQWTKMTLAQRCFGDSLIRPVRSINKRHLQEWETASTTWKSDSGTNHIYRRAHNLI